MVSKHIVPPPFKLWFIKHTNIYNRTLGTQDGLVRVNKPSEDPCTGSEHTTYKLMWKPLLLIS